jgi:hypothetical protein
MQFMVMRRASAATDTAAAPSREMIDALTRYVEKLAARGVIKGGGWLGPVSSGARIAVASSEARIMDGPFAETKEVIAGFAIIEAGSLAEVIEIVKDWPVFGQRAAEFDIRPILAPGELGFSAAQEARYGRIFAHEPPPD